MATTPHQWSYSSVYPTAHVVGPIYSPPTALRYHHVYHLNQTINGFADDHSMRQQHKPTSEIYSQVSTTMQTTLTSIKDWMDSMHLKLNTDKTEFMIFGSKHQLRKLDESTLYTNGELIQKSEVVRYLGGHLDASLTFETHIKSKVKTAMVNFIKIRSIQNYLSIGGMHHTRPSIMHITYRLCKCNTIWICQPRSSTSSNHFKTCAKLVLRGPKYSSSKEYLYKLYWLPVSQRIDYKILTLTHKCIQGQAPKYLQDLIAIKQKSNRNLRLSDASLILNQPHIRHKTFASQSFKYAAPYSWNQLPKHVRDIKELQNSKKLLKTHLFRIAFAGLNTK